MRYRKQHVANLLGLRVWRQILRCKCPPATHNLTENRQFFKFRVVVLLVCVLVCGVVFFSVNTMYPGPGGRKSLTIIGDRFVSSHTHTSILTLFCVHATYEVQFVYPNANAPRGGPPNLKGNTCARWDAVITLKCSWGYCYNSMQFVSRARNSSMTSGNTSGSPCAFIDHPVSLNFRFKTRKKEQGMLLRN